MPTEILIALLSLLGTLLGSAGGVYASNRLTAYRIEQLEKKVDLLNALVERTAVLERDQKTLFRLLDGARADIARAERRGGA